MREPDDYDDEYDAEDEALRWTCIGPQCCNPHIIHTRDECFTAEMVEAFMGQRDGDRWAMNRD